MDRQMHFLAASIFGAVIAVAVAVMVLVYATADSPPAGRVAVIFPPAASNEQAIAAITSAGARPIGQGWVRWVWAAQLDAATPEALEQRGALLVVREMPLVAALGCAGSFAATSYKVPR